MPKICQHALLYIRIKRGKIKVNHRSPEEWRFWLKVDKEGPIHPEYGQCWNWTGFKGKSGYGSFRFNKRTSTPHRFSWRLFTGDLPRDLFVLHRCDNRICVNPEHLFIGTHQDNMDDMKRKKRSASETNVSKINPELRQGESNGRAKLSEKEVRLILKIWDSSDIRYGLQSKLALQFGVNQPQIERIVHRKQWKHLADEE